VRRNERRIGLDEDDDEIGLAKLGCIHFSECKSRIT
jgi:hypothetical protein